MDEDKITEAMARALAAVDGVPLEHFHAQDACIINQHRKRAFTAWNAARVVLSETVLFVVMRDHLGVSVNWSPKILALLAEMDDQGEYADRLIDIAEELLDAADTNALSASPDKL